LPPSQRGAAGAEEGKAREVPLEELTQLRVSSLSPEAEEDDLRLLFRQFGHVDKIFIAKDKITGEPRGFAFVRFMAHDHAAAALRALNGFPYLHMILKIEWSKPDTRPPREGGGVYTGYGKALAHDSAQAQRASYH
jgi:translation initiation factor 3 subunit G